MNLINLKILLIPEGLSQVNTDKILILEKDLDKKLKKNLFKPKSMANNTCCKT